MMNRIAHKSCLQLYNYKGTVHSYNKDITEAIKQFMTAVRIAKEVDMKTEVVNEYNYALLMAIEKRQAYIRTDR